MVDKTGQIVREAKVASEPEASRGFLADLKLSLGRARDRPLSRRLHAGLTKACHDAVLLETRHVKAALSAMIVKTDRRDARGIAQLLTPAPGELFQRIENVDATTDGMGYTGQVAREFAQLTNACGQVLERAKGIEPSYAAWEAAVLPLNYARLHSTHIGIAGLQQEVRRDRDATMSIVPALVAFILAAGLLTVTPGLDTVLVLRTWLTDGRRAAWLAALGVQVGCLAWGSAVAVGLAAILEIAPVAYDVLRWFGAAYLVWCGVLLLAGPRERLDVATGVAPVSGSSAFRRGFLTNLLNPKVGLFYLSFLPQFVPSGLPATPFMILLTAIHIALALVWFALLLRGATALRHVVTRRAGVVRWLDRLTGTVFVGFGLRLALERR